MRPDYCRNPRHGALYALMVVTLAGAGMLVTHVLQAGTGGVPAGGTPPALAAPAPASSGPSASLLPVITRTPSAGASAPTPAGGIVVVAKTGARPGPAPRPSPSSRPSPSGPAPTPAPAPTTRPTTSPTRPAGPPPTTTARPPVPPPASTPPAAEQPPGCLIEARLPGLDVCVGLSGR